MSSPSIRCGCGAPLDGIQIVPGTSCRQCGAALTSPMLENADEATEAEIALLKRQVQRLGVEKELAELDRDWTARTNQAVNAGVVKRDGTPDKHSLSIMTLFVLCVSSIILCMLIYSDFGWWGVPIFIVYGIFAGAMVFRSIVKHEEIHRYVEERERYRERREELLNAIG
jgi:hypothetical protein